jgi:hypothetical protein
MQTYRNHSLQTLLIFVLLFLAAWIPRVQTIEPFVTPDENRGLARSANFYQAVSSGDLANTFQREHPGVTVMWAGTLGCLQRFPDYPQQAPGQVNWLTDELETWLERNSSITPLELLVAGRWWIVLAVSLAIAASYLPLQMLFGRLAAILAVLFIAWDPFFIALSRQLHPDGLLAALACLTFLTFLGWLYGSRRWPGLVISGVLLGITGLTKTPAVFVALICSLLLLGEWVGVRRQATGRPAGLLWGLVVWGAVALITFVGLWPALWVEALPVAQQVIGEMNTYMEGHSRTNFFLGQPTTDPGPIFYPIAFFFRATPAVLLGLMAAAVLAWQRRWPLDDPLRRRSALALVLFALLFAAGMSLGGKKFDRYILPAFPALAIVGSLGWLGLASWLQDRWRSYRARGQVEGANRAAISTNSGLVALTLAGLLLFHALPGFLRYPYFLTYYNPLAGGNLTAPRVLYLGWGEGLDEAAGWISQQPEADGARVISWYSIGPLSYYLRGPAAVWPYGTVDYWFSADYAVLYANQWQRQLPTEEIVGYFAGQEPVHVVELDGLEMARVYDLQHAPVPDFLEYNPKTAASFDYRILFKGYRLAEQVAFPGDTLQLTLFLEAMGPIYADYDVVLSLVGPEGSGGPGNPAWHSQGQPASGPTSQWPFAVPQQEPFEFSIPHNAPPGRYALMLSFHDPSTGQSLPLARGHGLAAGDGTTHRVAWVVVQHPDDVEVDARWDQVDLIGLRHQAGLAAGETLLVDMTAAGQVDASLKISTRLINLDGQVVAQNDKPLEARTRLELVVPDTEQPGIYRLAVVVYDPDTLAPYPDQHGESITLLSTVEVTAP